MHAHARRNEGRRQEKPEDEEHAEESHDCVAPGFMLCPERCSTAPPSRLHSVTKSRPSELTRDYRGQLTCRSQDFQGWDARTPVCDALCFAFRTPGVPNMLKITTTHENRRVLAKNLTKS